jgi:hypothetical protein
MSERHGGGWGLSKALARMILLDRARRRRLLLQLLLLVMGLLALGQWVLGGWLGESLVGFALWWGGCAVLAVAVVLLACYDVLAVVREERAAARAQRCGDD